MLPPRDEQVKQNVRDFLLLYGGNSQGDAREAGKVLGTDKV
jgi:hypothetical protein